MKGKSLAIAIAAFVIVAAIWEISARLGLYNSFLLPPPSQALAALVKLWNDGTLSSDLFDSMRRYIPGFLIGSFIGVAIGVLTGLWKYANDAVSPLFHYLRSIPPVALIPFVLIVFGISDLGKVSLVAWTCIFPVWISTYAGMRQVPKEYLQATQVFGVKGLRSVVDVWLPSSLPFIMNGLRIAIATGFFALVASEMFGASSGIGFRIVYSYQLFKTDEMVGMILLVGAIALVADGLLSGLRKLLVRWERA